MQFPEELGGDIVSAYTQLASNGTEFLAVAALLYAVGRLIFVPGVRWGLERTRSNRTIVTALTSATHLLVVGVTVVVAAGVAGFEGALAGSTLLAAAVTLAVGLAAQDVLGNFVSGAFIVTDPDLNVGDTIAWNGKRGTVVDIDLRVTRVQTPDNERIVVPNTSLTTSAVTNRTGRGPIGISYQFGVDYETDVEAVRDVVVVEVARNLDHVLEKPEPTTRVDELTANAVVVTARVWLPNNRRNRLLAVRAAFIQGVHESCRAEGIDLSETSQHAVSGELAVRDPIGTSDESAT